MVDVAQTGALRLVKNHARVERAQARAAWKEIENCRKLVARVNDELRWFRDTGLTELELVDIPDERLSGPLEDLVAYCDSLLAVADQPNQ